MLNELKVTFPGQVFLKALLSCHLHHKTHQGIDLRANSSLFSSVLGNSPCNLQKPPSHTAATPSTGSLASSFSYCNQLNATAQSVAL